MRKGFKSFFALLIIPLKINRYCLLSGFEHKHHEKRMIFQFTKTKRNFLFGVSKVQMFDNVSRDQSANQKLPETSSKLPPQTLVYKKWQTRSG